MKIDQYTDGTYLDKVPDWHAGNSPWKASKVFEMIERNHLSLNSICDVGCGAGQVLVELQKHTDNNVMLTGYDISPHAIKIAKLNENAHLKFHNDDFLNNGETSPDLILLLDVFEHVPDYLGFLDALKKKAAWIIFHIPLDMGARTVLRKSNYMLHMRQKYGHLHYFSKETALATLSDVGYDVQDCFYTDDCEISGGNYIQNLRVRINYQARKSIFSFNPDLAVSIFSSFNLMVLARGDRKL